MGILGTYSRINQGCEEGKSCLLLYGSLLTKVCLLIALHGYDTVV